MENEKCLLAWQKEGLSSAEVAELFGRHIFRWGMQSFPLKPELFKAENDKAIKQLTQLLQKKEEELKSYKAFFDLASVGKDPYKARIERLEASLKIADKMLSHVGCIQGCINGAIQTTDGDGESDCVQCQWCDEHQQVKEALKESVT